MNLSGRQLYEKTNNTRLDFNKFEVVHIKDEEGEVAQEKYVYQCGFYRIEIVQTPPSSLYYAYFILDATHTAILESWGGTAPGALNSLHNEMQRLSSDLLEIVQVQKDGKATS